MDAYLDVAAKVLRSKRRPLSARSILVEAFKAGLVPSNLYGKTQHKTLQARLSEDIVTRNNRSLFFRTAPGKFFLAEFLNDSSIPEEFRERFPARPRVRELIKGPALALKTNDVDQLIMEGEKIAPKKIFDLLQSNQHLYEDPKNPKEKSVLLRAFVCVRRKKEVLTYRVGRYRDDRDAFISRRSIGFSTLVNLDERTLFNMDTFGIIEAGIRAVKMDLDIPITKSGGDAISKEAALSCFILANHSSGVDDLLAIIYFRCPSWFEPTKRRLALNDLSWINIDKINNLEDFDPWSQKIISVMHKQKS